MKYGFIGAGNLACAIMRGMLQNNAARADEIAICEINLKRQAEICEELGVTAVLSADELVKNAEVIFLVVKPYQLENVLAELRDAFALHKPLIVSLAAGKAVSFVETHAGEGLPIIRVLPNINAAVGESMSWMCGNAHTTQAHKDTVLHCFNAIGKTVEIDEKLHSIYTTIGASAPAFAYLFIESIAKGAHKAGLNKQQALEIAAQTVLGSAKMILESGKHPWELIDQVCSPGGMTIEGVSTLEENRFQSAVVAAVEATIAKDRRL